MRFGQKDLVHLQVDLLPIASQAILNKAIALCNIKPEVIAHTGLDERLGNALTAFNDEGRIHEFLQAFVYVNEGAEQVVEKWLARLASAPQSPSSPPIGASGTNCRHLPLSSLS